MKKNVRNIVILILPFVILIGVNEAVRPTIKETPFSFHGITAINPSGKMKDKCTWFCHNQTDYCKIHHVKLLGNHFEQTDKAYFGLINLLRSTGHYGLANIIVLSLLVPFLLWFLFIKSLHIQDEISNLKKNHDDR